MWRIFLFNNFCTFGKKLIHLGNVKQLRRLFLIYLNLHQFDELITIKLVFVWGRGKNFNYFFRFFVFFCFLIKNLKIVISNINYTSVFNITQWGVFVVMSHTLIYYIYNIFLLYIYFFVFLFSLQKDKYTCWYLFLFLFRIVPLVREYKNWFSKFF